MIRIKSLLSFVALVITAVNAQADYQYCTTNGITWRYYVSNGEANLYFYNGDPAISKSTAGDIEIPSSLNGYPVTFIDRYAFYECRLLTSVKMPNSIRSIGEYAFQDCHSLTNVTMSSGLISIGSYAFRYCSSLAKITIPNRIETIHALAFQGCKSLESVTLPKSVISISDDAFSGCDRLNASWQRTIANLSVMGIGSGNGEAVVKNAAAYNLSSELQDRVIANIEIEGDTAIDSFVLKDGKVFDCSVRIVNKSEKGAKVSLPKGFVYEKFRGTKPLHIPAASTNLLTITRTKGNTFLISREELVTEVVE